MANGQPNIMGLLSNPLFMSGMGLLSGSQPGGNPYAGLLGGLSQSQQNQLAMDERQRDQEMRRAMLQFFAGDQGQTGASPQTQALAQTRPAGLLDGNVAGATRQVVPEQMTELPGGVSPALQLGDPGYIPTDADIDADPSVSVGPARVPDAQIAALDPGRGQGEGLLAETPGNVVGTPRQEMAQATTQAQGLLGGAGPGSIAGGTAMPQDVRALFGLLAQYGDPQQAAEGYMNYQLAQQRLSAQASQARTRGFSPIVDNDGKVWFPDANAPGGVVAAIDPNTNEQITAPAGVTYQTDQAGNIYSLPKTTPAGTAPTPRAIVSAEDVERDVQTRQDIERQATARRNLTGIEDMVSRPGGAWETINAMLAPEMEDAAAALSGGSALWAVPWSKVAWGSDAASFNALKEKLTSQEFLASVQELRATGATLGQLTEQEGFKLETARLALMNAQDDEQFYNEMLNVREALVRYIKTARREAGVDELTPFAPGGVDLRTRTQRAQDEQSAVEIEGTRLQQLQERYPTTTGQ